MTCDETLVRLDDHVEGGLPEEEQAEVARHLRDCSRCREEERALRSFLAAAVALPREVAPSRDLWPGIAQRVGRQAALRRPALLATAAVLAVGIASALLRWEAPAPLPGKGVPVSTEVGSLKTAEADYERATSALLAALEARRESLAPQTLESVERNLAVIDRAMAEVRDALRREPGNPELTRMLVSTHRKKVDVLRRVVKLTTI